MTGIEHWGTITVAGIYSIIVVYLKSFIYSCARRSHTLIQYTYKHNGDDPPK